MGKSELAQHLNRSDLGCGENGRWVVDSGGKGGVVLSLRRPRVKFDEPSRVCEFTVKIKAMSQSIQFAFDLVVCEQKHLFSPEKEYNYPEKT